MRFGKKGNAPRMRTKTSTAPAAHPRSTRTHRVDYNGKMEAGVLAPITAIPLLRGDALKATSVSIQVAMDETADIVRNGINVSVSAYLVPFMAFERFERSYDQLTRSYMGKPQIEGGSVVPFIQLADIGDMYARNHIHRYLGAHVTTPTNTNTAYISAYNCIVNHMLANRSKKLTLRDELELTVAPAFWDHNRVNRYVAEFDPAMIDGEVELEIVEADLPVKSLAQLGHSGDNKKIPTSGTTTLLPTDGSGNVDWTGAIWAELGSTNAKLFLSKVAMARRTKQLAEIRQQYAGLPDDEDYFVDTLMQGLSIPDLALAQPILIDSQSGALRTMARYSTDANALDTKTVNAMGSFQLHLATPRVDTGGVVMIVMQVLPDQIFERTADPFLEITDVEELPRADRDIQDSQPVDYVRNKEIDVTHNAPEEVFGFQGKNAKWNIDAVRLGGGMIWKPVDPQSFERNMLWIEETEDARLNEDWYQASNVNQSIFLDTTGEPFYYDVKGLAKIEGLTVFGPMLEDAAGEYDEVAALQDHSRLEQTEADTGA